MSQYNGSPDGNDAEEAGVAFETKGTVADSDGELIKLTVMEA